MILDAHDDVGQTVVTPVKMSAANAIGLPALLMERINATESIAERSIGPTRESKMVFPRGSRTETR